ncbi:hypothetical protein AGMMS49545_01150 [Betaproteobacteria bacterium]|nr:hypothetical protein AGMMS49545_01150 [Betaproteobacteria bacterium]GHU48960.1 hypothetical protein AGMMS50289_25950 [Betaproteobacteria bacterium]
MKRLKQLQEKIASLSRRERGQLSAGVCVGIALLYGLLLWPLGHQQLSRLKYDESKLAVQQRNSGKNTPVKAAPGGLSLQQARQELVKTQESLISLNREQTRLNERFIPLEDLESLQALKSELTRLAEEGDMEMIALEHIYRRPEDRERAPSLELLKEAGQSNPYKRPLLCLRARASYRGLMQFLDGLQQLPRIAAPVWSNIEVKSEKPDVGRNSRNNADHSGRSGTPRQWLEVEIRLAI